MTEGLKQSLAIIHSHICCDLDPFYYPRGEERQNRKVRVLLPRQRELGREFTLEEITSHNNGLFLLRLHRLKKWHLVSVEM